MEIKKSSEIGLKQGRILANLPRERQLDLIAEGLPILLASASDLLKATDNLDGHPRVSEILRSQAREECSKILILMDVVRCPPNLVASKIGCMMGWFYDHTARLIYSDAQTWKPTDVAMLQSYVDGERRSHSLEGAFGEFILPNWTTFSRESLLYADILTDEAGEPVWNVPEASPSMFDHGEPIVFRLCDALSDYGFFKREGLDIVADLWGRTDFAASQDCWSSRALIYEALLRMNEKGLIAESADEDQQRWLYNSWQVPMYNIDFKRIQVPLEQLQAERAAILWAEF